MNRARVVAFVSGGALARESLHALACDHDLVAIARPMAAPASLRGRVGTAVRHAAARAGLGKRDDIDAFAAARSIPVVRVRGGDDTAAAKEISRHAPHLACIATFPFRLGPDILAAVPIVLNVHPSLLPRHRGPDPLFWVYHSGDEDAGVSVHVATSRTDAGPVVAQAVVPLRRGTSVVDLHERCAREGSRLLAEAAAMHAAGAMPTRPQDDALATRAPRVRPGVPMAAFDRWTAAHAWHYLAGLRARYTEPLTDAKGSIVDYGMVPGYHERDPQARPGSVTTTAGGWIVWCHDGGVELARRNDRS